MILILAIKLLPLERTSELKSNHILEAAQVLCKIEFTHREKYLRHSHSLYPMKLYLLLIPSKSFLTFTAVIFFLPSVSQFVLCQCLLLCKIFVTLATQIQFLSRMKHLVFKQIFNLDKTFATMAALIGVLPCVYSLVLQQSFLMGKAFVTLAVLILYFSSLHCLVVTLKITYTAKHIS